MKIGVYYNTKQVERSTAEALAQSLRREGADAAPFSRLPLQEAINRLLVLGGDGTMLHAAKYAAEIGIPLLGINYGTLGFLTEFERGEESEAVRLAVHGETVCSRSMLEVTLNGVRTVCLNECAVLHAVSAEEGPKVTRICAEIEGLGRGEFLADGLIVATPTGSTAYSLSAGGCILSPDCPSFLLTPVCAVSVRSRPIAFSDERPLTFSLLRESHMLVYGDGIFLGTFGTEDELTVRKAPVCARFLTRNHSAYFGRLTSKLN